jgi:hypothetical protein
MNLGCIGGVGEVLIFLATLQRHQSNWLRKKNINQLIEF